MGSTKVHETKQGLKLSESNLSGTGNRREGRSHDPWGERVRRGEKGGDRFRFAKGVLKKRSSWSQK